MNLKGMVMLVIGIFGVLLMALAMQETMGGDWTTVAQDVAPAILFIVIFGVTIAAILGRR